MSSGVLQSHTATQQWQSFEIRMRRRRVERCVLRASVAIEVGVLDDAREALEEVQRLDPHEPSIESLRAQLAAAEAAPAAFLPIEPSISEAAVADRPPLETPLDDAARGHAWQYAMALVLVALSGGAGWFLFSDQAAIEPAAIALADPVPSAPARAAPPRPSQPAVGLTTTAFTPTAATEPAGTGTEPIATSGSATPVVGTGPPAAPGTAAVAPVAAPPPLAAPPPATAGSASNVTTPEPAAISERPLPVAVLLEPAPPLSESPPTSPVAIAGVEGIALSDTAVTLTAPSAAEPAKAAPVTPLPAVPSPTPDEHQVRAILSRYEAAYSSLDAAAAAAVWPGVDRRALASAFQGLSTQTVSLGRCDVRVSGATAQAECTGMARWNPKVGGGPQTASRHWRFDLRSTGSDWVITRATVR